MTVTLLRGVVGCSNIIYDDYPVESGSETELVTLVLNVGMVAESRAGADNPRESMHDLRIVLLDASGKVEYNEYIPLTGVERFGEKIIRTVPGAKKIFLIANEKSLSSVRMTGADFAGLSGRSLSYVMESDAAKVGAANFEALAEAIYFTPGDYGQMNIPLSSSYEFTIPVGAKRIEQTFYLVHAATKFEFKFINERESAVRIDALSISSLAEDMYLMANFGETPATRKTVEWTQNGTARSAYWIDWLREVSDATTSNPADPDNERVNGTYGWIPDYELPPTEPQKPQEHKTRNLIAGENPAIAATYDNIPVASAETPSVTLPTVYFPESKNIPAAAANRQDYSFSVKLTDTGSNTSKEFSDIRLNYISGSQDNLVTLFRNTHVKVTCTVGYEAQDMTLNLLIGICPWNYEEINIPTFD